MWEDEKITKIPDDFWDISSLIPKKNFHVPVRPAVEAVEIALPSSGEAREEESTVIQRMIPGRGTPKKQMEYTELVSSYAPAHSLIHEVTVKRRNSPYPFYEDFYADALRLTACVGEACAYVPYFSYSPQYNQLSPEQLAYFLWWRDNARRGVFLKTDYSYVLLSVYELINLGASVDTKQSLFQLTALWNAYHDQFPSLEAKLSTWICDFGLVHGLSPAENVTNELVKRTASLMEYYISIPDGDRETCAKALLKYCTAYAYQNSKFATKENLPLFELHIYEAVKLAVDYFSENGKMLSKLACEDSGLTREAYAGALCTAREKYQISIKYCSFSRTNELRYLIGDIIKYAENKLRAWLGVKSRLSVYSLSNELQSILDQYFANALAKPRQRVVKAQEKHEYDVLYDVPHTPLSLSMAQQIEQDSWTTTNELLAAFEETETIVSEATTLERPVASKRSEPMQMTDQAEGEEFLLSFGEYATFVRAVWLQDRVLQKKEAERLEKMQETIVDAINEQAVDAMGDILIEETDDGWAVIECYRDLWVNGGEGHDL